MSSAARESDFGRLPDGRAVRLVTLDAGSGLSVALTNYGASIVRLSVPDRAGRPGDIALGFASAAEYAAQTAYLGCVVGRFGGRIAGGRFVLGGREYRLATNNFPAGRACHLHGGRVGFDRVPWEIAELRTGPQPAVRFRHRSPDGDEGYPGTVVADVTYTLTADRGLRIDYAATADQVSPLNLTQHCYFNLRGEGAGDILGHELQLRAEAFLEVDAGLIPTGVRRPTAGTPFDFSTPVALGARIDAPDEQLRLAGGYDHTFVAAPSAAAGPAWLATLRDPESGRIMETLTTEPGVQLYTGNFLDGSLTGKSGRPYGRRHGVCLETQHFPDSPNRPEFPAAWVGPDRPFASTTIYRFRAE